MTDRSIDRKFWNELARAAVRLNQRAHELAARLPAESAFAAPAANTMECLKMAAAGARGIAEKLAAHGQN